MKTALITGATGGIGGKTAEVLGQAGYEVIVTGIDEAGRDTVMSNLESKGIKAHFYKCDATSEEQVNETFAKIAEKFDHLDLLVNNVGGLGGRQRVSEMETGFMRKVMALNFDSLFFNTRAALPLLKKGTNPSIINFSTISDFSDFLCLVSPQFLFVQIAPSSVRLGTASRRVSPAPRAAPRRVPQRSARLSGGRQGQRAHLPRVLRREQRQAAARALPAHHPGPQGDRVRVPGRRAARRAALRGLLSRSPSPQALPFVPISLLPGPTDAVSSLVPQQPLHPVLHPQLHFPAFLSL